MTRDPRARAVDATESHDAGRAAYGERGFTVVREAIPPALVNEFRTVADRLRTLVHDQDGAQVQVTDPVAAYADRVDLGPFDGYLTVAGVHAAIRRLLGSEFTYGGLDEVRVLIEPFDHPWEIGWHRDRVGEVPAAGRDRRFRSRLSQWWDDPRYFHQVHAALYPDSCTWYVPGSHARQADGKGEHETLGSSERNEPALVERCREFPGAVRIDLEPGDLLVYNQLGWHNGTYSPNRPRATVHHLVRHPTSPQFERTWRRTTSAAVARHRMRRLLRDPVGVVRNRVTGREPRRRHRRR